MSSAPDSWYKWAFVAAVSGDRWFGDALGDSTLYEANQIFQANHGTWLILSESFLGYDLSDAGYTQYQDGAVYTSHYYDSATNQIYTPYYYSLGYQSGAYGIGSELDWVMFANGEYDDFGYYGHNQAQPSWIASQTNVVVDVLLGPALQTGDYYYPNDRIG